VFKLSIFLFRSLPRLLLLLFCEGRQTLLVILIVSLVACLQFYFSSVDKIMAGKVLTLGAVCQQ